MTGKHTWIIPAALLTAVLLLTAAAGCGGKSPSEILNAGLDKSSTAVSLKADIQVETEPENGSRSMPLTLEGTAAVDTVARAASISFEVMGLGAELRYVGGRSFLEMGGEWFSLSGGDGDFLSALAAGIAEAAFSYPELLRQYTSIDDLGLEKAGGRECHHLRLSLNLQGLAGLPAVEKIGKLLEVDSSDLASELESLAPGVEVWVDRQDSYIRKITITARLDAGEGLLGIDLIKGRMGVKGTAVFSGYDIPLDIEAPDQASPFDSTTLPF